MQQEKCGSCAACVCVCECVWTRMSEELKWPQLIFTAPDNPPAPPPLPRQYEINAHLWVWVCVCMLSKWPTVPRPLECRLRLQNSAISILKSLSF